MYRQSMKFKQTILVLSIVFCLLLSDTQACGPGRNSPNPRGPSRLSPFVYKQYTPKISEDTVGASGAPEGRITRDDERFKELTPNHNSDIIFKDEEGTGADRLMTQRCKDKLNSLAILVMNQWEGIQLRVTEGWDEDGHHAENSLHYEGRAVDITTSDRDKKKYGMLARLAVQAGFDWVYFESKSHVHCSVRSEHAEGLKSGGCFPTSATVTLENGRTKTMDQIELKDKVMSVNKDGDVVFSEVIMILDKNPTVKQIYHVIENEDYGYKLVLSAGHLVYASKFNVTFDPGTKPVYAEDVKIGHYIYVAEGVETGTLKPVKVTNKTKIEEFGVYAPLTVDGRIVVDGTLTSCYAMVDHDLAHFAFAPLRLLHRISTTLWYFMAQFQSEGVHWYPKLVYTLTAGYLDQSLIHPNGIVV
ncbi:sonic hedgehog protein-like [Ptychodera flava]|uniref:Hedgehog protein n=1 Tax=Ptychodera flava TaxID=63121 RepID=A0A0D3S0E3_PTYFL|nr:hedgehog [Ptychodera flava]